MRRNFGSLNLAAMEQQASSNCSMRSESVVKPTFAEECHELASLCASIEDGWDSDRKEDTEVGLDMELVSRMDEDIDQKRIPVSSCSEVGRAVPCAERPPEGLNNALCDSTSDPLERCCGPSQVDMEALRCFSLKLSLASSSPRPSKLEGTSPISPSAMGDTYGLPLLSSRLDSMPMPIRRHALHVSHRNVIQSV